MKIFYLLVMSMCLLSALSTLCAKEPALPQECGDEEDKSLIQNELDMGQKFCDSRKHNQKKDLDAKPIEDENLKKFQEFLHSFDCGEKVC